MKTALLILSSLILFSCKDRQVKTDSNPIGKSPQSLPIINDDSVVLALSRQVLTTIKTNDYRKLAQFVHPTLGIRFSPYAYIDTIANVKFNREDFLDGIKTQKKLNWGNYDGSGDSIILSVEDYFSKFVYDADFLNAEKTSLNKMIGSGNSLNNLETIYKDCYFTESYFSGFDKKYEGMDWRCLRLVFKKQLDKFYLIAIVHDQWTT